jgi:tryptophan-rich sensory protein
MKTKSIIKLFSAVLICLGAGFVGSFFTTPEIATWYQTINKPIWNPPSWLFGPVWTTLFILMGIALFLIWQKAAHSKSAHRAVVFFLVHLLFNIFWSVAFFNLHSPFYAFIAIIVLWLMIFTLMLWFFRLDKKAGALLIPYLFWVSFAGYLNYTIWQLN